VFDIPKGEYARLLPSRVGIYFSLEIDWDKIGENEEDMYEGKVDLVCSFLISSQAFSNWFK